MSNNVLFPQVLVLKEKHDDRYYHITSEAMLHETARAIVKNRILEGWYFDDAYESGKTDAVKASAIPSGAWKFLLTRSRKAYEYEYVALETYDRI